MNSTIISQGQNSQGIVLYVYPCQISFEAQTCWRFWVSYDKKKAFLEDLEVDTQEELEAETMMPMPPPKQQTQPCKGKAAILILYAKKPLKFKDSV